MRKLLWLLIFVSVNLYGQKVTLVETKTILNTANSLGLDSAFSKLVLRNGFFYLDLIDSNLTLSLCSRVESIDKSNFDHKYLIRSAGNLTDTIINNKLLGLLHKYRESFSTEVLYQDYPNYELFKALAYQNFKSSIPTLRVEYEFWDSMKHGFTDTSSRNFKMVSTIIEWFSETIKYISEFQLDVKSKKNYFYINRNISPGREAVSPWDTVRLQKKIKNVQEIEFRREPYFIEHFEYADFLNKKARIEICYNGNKAVVSLYYFPWDGIYQMELLSNNRLAIRFLTGGIE